LSPDKGYRLPVKVTPNAGRNEITGCKEGIWHVKIGAPPDKGKANKELVDFMADTLGLRKSAISIIKGLSSHNKLLSIEGLGEEQITRRLAK